MSKKTKDMLQKREAQERAAAEGIKLTRDEETARDSGLQSHMRQDVPDIVNKLEAEIMERKRVFREVKTLLDNFGKDVKNAHTKTVLSEKYHLLMEELELFDAAMDSLVGRLAPKHERRREFIREMNNRKESSEDLASKFNDFMEQSDTQAAGS